MEGQGLHILGMILYSLDVMNQAYKLSLSLPEPDRRGLVYMQLHMLQPSLWVRIYSFLSIRDEKTSFKMLKEKKLTMFLVLKKKQSVTVTEGNPILV